MGLIRYPNVSNLRVPIWEDLPMDLQVMDAESWETPEAEVICLACEISAYAPDEEGPLF